MKILEINTERTWRGGERQTLYDMQGHVLQGDETTVLCRQGFPLEEQCIKHGLSTIGIRKMSQLIWFLMWKAKKFDIIHCQTSKAQQMAVLTKWFHRKKVVYTRRLDFVPSGSFSIWKYKKTDCVVTITPAIKKIIEGIGVKKTALISEIVEAKKLSATRAQNYLEEHAFGGKKIIATTAALVQHKDPLTMVRAMDHLRTLRTDFVFLHFGKGILMDSVKQEIERRKLGDFYYLAGFIENAEDMFSVFDVFAMSSEEEGLGSSVLDAFMYKVPVASTNAGGLRDIVTGYGLVSPVKDHVALAENINRLLNDNALKKELTEKAYEKARREHSLENISRAYHQLFASLCV